MNNIFYETLAMPSEHQCPFLEVLSPKSFCYLTKYINLRHNDNDFKQLDDKVYIHLYQTCCRDVWGLQLICLIAQDAMSHF